MLKNYFKIAWRNLWKNKVYALTNLAGLSIGLACVMLITLFVKDELSYDRFHEKAPRLYRIVNEAGDPEGNTHTSGISGPVHGPGFQAEIPEITSICRMLGGSALVKKEKEVISEGFLYADSTFFQLFSFRLLEGNPSSVLTGANGIIISEKLATKYFNSIDVVGKTLEMNIDGEMEAFTVEGLAENTPLNSTIQFDMLLPMSRRLKGVTSDWTSFYVNTFVLLNPQANLKQVEAKMERVKENHMGKEIEEMRKSLGSGIYMHFKLQPFLEVHLTEEYSTSNGLQNGSNANYSYILGGIALFILLIACINFINLTLGRSIGRGKEIALRKVNGSSRKQLIAQFLGEAFILTLLAFIPAILFVKLSLPFFSELAHKKLEAFYLLETQSVILFALLLIVNTLLAGFYPAMVLSGQHPVRMLSGKLKLNSRNYLGKSLVVAQFIIAVFLMTGTFIMQKQFGYLIHKDLGYDPEGVVTVMLPWNQEGAYLEVFKNELSSHTFISEIGGQSSSFTGFTGMGIKVEGKEWPGTAYKKIDNHFLPLLNIPLISGRNFFNSAGDSLNCIVNKAFVNEAGWNNPIGQIVEWGDKELRIIGVTEDFHHQSLKSKIEPLLMNQRPTEKYGEVMMKIDPQRKEEAIQAIRNVWNKLIPTRPLNYSFLEDTLSRQYESEKRWKNIVSIAAALSVFISCLGLFGLAALAIENRTKEIGIRKVLGASVSSIMALLSKGFIQLVLLAICIAAPLAWYAMNRWLEDFAYRIELQWWMFALAGLLAVVIALLTVSFQSVKAALMNPVKSLRSD